MTKLHKEDKRFLHYVIQRVRFSYRGMNLRLPNNYICQPVRIKKGKTFFPVNKWVRQSAAPCQSCTEEKQFKAWIIGTTAFCVLYLIIADKLPINAILTANGQIAWILCGCDNDDIFITCLE